MQQVVFWVLVSMWKTLCKYLLFSSCPVQRDIFWEGGQSSTLRWFYTSLHPISRYRNDIKRGSQGTGDNPFLGTGKKLCVCVYVNDHDLLNAMFPLEKISFELRAVQWTWMLWRCESALGTLWGGKIISHISLLIQARRKSPRGGAG